MRKVLTILLVVVVVAAAMLAITYFVPEVRQVADKMAKDKHTPWVLAGLIAPIAYLFKRVGEWLRSFFSTDSEEKLTRENDEIKRQLAAVRSDIDRIDALRTQEIRAHQEKIAALDTRLASVLQQIGQVDQELAAVGAKRPEDLVPADARDFTESLKKNVSGFVVE
jgi:prefoldin subunit 5